MAPPNNTQDWVQALVASRTALRAFLAYPQATAARVQTILTQAQQAVQLLHDFTKFQTTAGLSLMTSLAVAGDDSQEPFAASVSLAVALRETCEFWLEVIARAEERKLDWGHIEPAERAMVVDLLKVCPFGEPS